MQVRLGQGLVDAGLIGAERTAALQQQHGLFEPRVSAMNILRRGLRSGDGRLHLRRRDRGVFQRGHMHLPDAVALLLQIYGGAIRQTVMPGSNRFVSLSKLRRNRTVLRSCHRACAPPRARVRAAAVGPSLGPDAAIPGIFSQMSRAVFSVFALLLRLCDGLAASSRGVCDLAEGAIVLAGAAGSATRLASASRGSCSSWD